MTTTERTPLVPKSPETLSRLDFALLMTGLWIMVFIGSLDGTIVATLISSIGSSFEAMKLSSWIGTSYLLSVCCFTPLYGRLCNIIGRRASALMAAGLFGVGTVLCGFAGSIYQLLAFRALAGMGGGGMSVVSSVIISDVIPLKSRGLYQGFANMLYALGAAVGAPIGGWLGDTVGWRAAFLMQTPFFIMGITLLYLKVREPEDFMSSTTSMREKLARVDFAGSATLVATLGSLVVGMSFKSAGNREWSDPRVWGLLAASGVWGVVFLLVETKWAAEPVMPFSLLKERTAGFVALNNFLIALLSFSTIYNAPLFYTAALLRTSANAGTHLMPNSASIAVGSLVAGWYMRKTGKYWWPQAIVSLGIIGSNIILATWSKDTPEWIFYVTLMPSGFGFAFVLTTTLLAIIASVGREQIPIATGISYLFRTAGQVLGVSLSATITQSILAQRLRARIVGEGSEAIIEKILDSTAYIRTLPDDLKAKVMESWALALRTVFKVQIVVAVLLFLSLLPIGEHPLPDTVSPSPQKTQRTEEEEGNGV